MGANVVRFHLQFDDFIKAPDKINPHALKAFKQLLDIAEEVGVYLNITGLSSYQPEKRSKWYDDLDEKERWVVQAYFWKAIAKAGAERSVIFCYNVMNEPIIPSDKKEKRAWYSGRLGGYDFGQRLTLTPEGRTEEEIAVQWMDKMISAIRTEDDKTLITTGFLPWMSKEFVTAVAPKLDFLSTHIYPRTGKVEESIKRLENFKVAKPVVIEEIFPLKSDTTELTDFMRKSKSIANGWLGHYLMSDTIEELEEKKNKSDKELLYKGWLELFVRLKPEFVPKEES